jgi:hypothetical protein
LIKAGEANPGFRPEHVISVRIALPAAAYKTARQTTGFFDRLLARLSALPGVRQTGALSDLPMNSTLNVVISIEGRSGETEKVDVIRCFGNALDALGVSLKRGRMPRPDDQFGKQPVAVISQALAERVWPHADPIGRRIRFGVEVPNNGEPWLTIVGVVADVKARLTSNAPRLLLFAATTQKNWDNQMNVVVRTAEDPLLLASVFRHCLRLSGAGIVIGLVASVAATRGLSTLLYDTSPLDAGTFAAVPFILMLVALGAALIPAWRVVRMNPITALRGE